MLAALTKGGLAAATRSLAVEYASRGIRVNAVSPGIIQTPVHPPDSYDGLGDRLPPLGRVGQVSDVVDGILFLESSPYITGEILHIDGGQIAGHWPSMRPANRSVCPRCANARPAMRIPVASENALASAIMDDAARSHHSIRGRVHRGQVARSRRPPCSASQGIGHFRAPSAACGWWLSGWATAFI